MSTDVKAVIGLLFLVGMICTCVGLWLLLGTAWCLLLFGLVCVGVSLFGVWVSG